MSDESRGKDWRTPEGRLLDGHPGTRELVETIPEFVEWRGALPVVEVDGEELWVARGDQLMERDQVVVEWVRMHRPDLLEKGQGNGGEGNGT